MKASPEQVLDLILQPKRPYRPIRLVFASANGPEVFEYSQRGGVGFWPWRGRFAMTRGKLPAVDRQIEDLIAMGYIDELDGGTEPGPDGLRHAS